MSAPGEPIRIGRGITIQPSELEWRFSASGGPGGQHANTSNTRAEVVFDIASSPSLPETARARLLAKFGPTVSVVSSEHRSQWQNRRAATERLRVQLASALVVPRRRVDTKPTLGSKQRRLETKRRTGERKAARRRPGRED